MVRKPTRSPAKLSRRHLVRSAAVGTAAASLSGAVLARSVSASFRQEGATEITFLGPENPEAFQPVIDGFHSAQENVRVTYVNVPFAQLATTLNSRFSTADSTFDCYTVDQSRVPARAARGQLVDLTGMVDNVEEAVLAPQYEASTYNGQLYSLPIWTSMQTLYYNVSLLEEAGVTPPGIRPEDRWTWEQVIEAATQVQSAGLSDWGLVFEQVNGYYQLQPLPESLGGGSGLTGDDLLTVDLTNEGFTASMEWYGGLFEQGISPRGIDASQTAQLFLDGATPFYVGLTGRTDFELAKAEERLNWSAAPHPYFDGGTIAVPTDSWSWGINPFSTKQDATLEFMKYASLNPVGARESIELVPLPPANQEAFASYLEELQDRPTQPEGISDLIEYEFANSVVHRPRSLGYVEFEYYMNSKTFPDISNGANVGEALQEAQDELTAQLDQIRQQLDG